MKSLIFKSDENVDIIEQYSNNEKFFRTDIYFSYCLHGYENSRQKKMRKIPMHDGHIVGFIPFLKEEDLDSVTNNIKLAMILEQPIAGQVKTGNIVESKWRKEPEEETESRRTKNRAKYYYYHIDEDKYLWTDYNVEGMMQYGNYLNVPELEIEKYEPVLFKYEFMDNKMKPVAIDEHLASEGHFLNKYIYNSQTYEEWYKAIEEWLTDIIIINGKTYRSQIEPHLSYSLGFSPQTEKRELRFMIHFNNDVSRLSCKLTELDEVYQNISNIVYEFEEKEGIKHIPVEMSRFIYADDQYQYREDSDEYRDWKNIKYKIYAPEAFRKSIYNQADQTDTEKSVLKNINNEIDALSNNINLTQINKVLSAIENIFSDRYLSPRSYSEYTLWQLLEVFGQISNLKFLFEINNAIVPKNTSNKIIAQAKLWLSGYHSELIVKYLKIQK